MALFSKKQTADAPAEGTAPAKAQARRQSAAGDLTRVLSNPRITEKATDLQQQSAYVFDISADATKPQIAQAVRDTYKVTPVKVRVVTIRPKVKRSMRTGRTGVRGGGRKAYVFLKKGDSITLA
jgi:large subunit ribosomal protein L23